MFLSSLLIAPNPVDCTVFPPCEINPDTKAKSKSNVIASNKATKKP